jgi:hypothetical protein
MAERLAAHIYPKCSSVMDIVNLLPKAHVIVGNGLFGPAKSVTIRTSPTGVPANLLRWLSHRQTPGPEQQQFSCI